MRSDANGCSWEIERRIGNRGSFSLRRRRRHRVVHDLPNLERLEGVVALLRRDEGRRPCTKALRALRRLHKKTHDLP